MTLLVFAWTSLALAQDAGDYLNLSFSGDGESPTTLERFTSASARGATRLQGGVEGSATGSASWSLPIALPPARQAPSVSVAYDSGGGHGRLGRGFSLQVGPTIRRLTGRDGSSYLRSVAGQQVIDDEVRLVEGPGFHGVTWRVGSTWAWASDQPGPVSVAYDDPTDVFTIRRDDVTWTFAPGASTSVEPDQWFVRSQVDLSGNRIDWIWGSDEVSDRIEAIHFGGTDPSGWLVEVAFDWRPAAHGQFSGSAGLLRDLSQRLSAVRVASRYEQALADERRWLFDYDPDDLYLIRISEDGPGTAERVVASFDYGRWVDDHESSLDVPGQLGVSQSWSEPFGGGFGGTDTSLRDLGADGLPDVVRSVGRVGRMRLDHPFWDPANGDEVLDIVDRSWEDPWSAVDQRPADAATDLQFERTRTVLLEQPGVGPDPDALVRGTYAVSRWIDLDSDGYPDELLTSEEPYDWSTAPTGSAVDDNAAHGSFTWSVRWGRPDGFEPATSENTPFRFPRVSVRPDLPTHGAAAFVDGPFDFEEATLDLLDVDGDGWQDIVVIDEAGRVWVYDRVPVAGFGWSSVGRQVLQGVMVASTSRSRGYVQPSSASLVEVSDIYVDDFELPRLEFMEQQTGFLDLDGDGKLDFVDTLGSGCTGRGWEVWLGDGLAFADPRCWAAPTPWITRTDEGFAATTVCSDGGLVVDPAPYLDQVTEAPDLGGVSFEPLRPCGDHASVVGRPSSVIGGLVDIDGDGRQDLMVGEQGLWYPNLGDGFATVGRPVPGFLPDAAVGVAGVSSYVLSVQLSQSIVMVSTAPGPSTDPAVVAASQNHTELQTLVMVTDLDGDRLPDVVDLRQGQEEVRYSGRSVDAHGFVSGGRPGLLSRIELGSGATTDLAYRSSSTLLEVGADQEIYAPIHTDLLRSVTTYDPVTSWRGSRRFFQFQPVQIPGRPLGFAQIEEEERERRMDQLFGLPPQQGDARLGRTTTVRSLERDHQLQVMQVVETDRNAVWVPGLQGLDRQEHPRFVTEWTYDDHELPGSGTKVLSRWVSAIDVVEYDEVRGATTDTSRAWTTEVEYDAVGNVELQRHTSVDDPWSEVAVDPSWTTDGVLWRPASFETSSFDADHNWVVVELGLLDHDPQGRLTGQHVCIDPGCADALEWVFGRTARGAVDHVGGPLGRDTYHDLFAFGETTIATRRRAIAPVDHVDHQATDALGRVEVVTDVNGVVHTTHHDAFGRPTEVWRQGVGGPSLLVARTTYDDQAMPRNATTDHYRYEVDALGNTVTVHTTSHVVFDGFGEVVQTWAPAPGVGFVVAETERDVRGVERRTSEPHVEAVFSTDFVRHRGPNRTWSFVDLLGDPVLAWDLDTSRWDAGSGAPAEPGYRRSEWVAPGTRREVFGDWERQEVTDTLGRRAEIHEGFVGGTVRTGTYTYDGRDRVLEFEDGNGDRWRYRYDLAGRVLQVRRNPGAGFSDYVGYDWNGPDPSCLYEGTRGVGPCAASWTYDDLGRTTTKTVLDPVVATVTTSWQWDRDPAVPGSDWLGARHVTTDASGSTRYTYGAGAFGRLGDVTRTMRTFVGGMTATFARVHDNEGNPLLETWPSGRKVRWTYHPNGAPWSAQVTTTTGAATYELDYRYDGTYGLPAGYALSATSAAGTFDVDQSIERNTSTQVARQEWVRAVGGVPLANKGVRYRWGEGLLRVKKVNNDDDVSYTYDALGRIAAVYDTNYYEVYPPPGTYEEYRYDVGGTPTVTSERLPMASGGGQQGYTYDPSAAFNEVSFRYHVGAQTFDWFDYDGMSRLVGWDTEVAGVVRKARTFAYDGAGRLRKQGGAAPVVYAYDVDDQLVEERRGSGPAATVVRRFDGWRWQQSGNVTTEQVLPMLRLSGPLATVVATEPDGHAVMTWTWSTQTGLPASSSTDVVGVYGRDLADRSWQAPVGTPPWPLDGFHGAEPDAGGELVHFGARHMLTRDGLWMQPEPLLYLGLTNGDLANPRGFGGLYAMGNSNAYEDQSGHFITPVFLAIVNSMTAPANAPGPNTVPEAPTGMEALNTAAMLVGVGEVAAVAFADDAAAGLITAGTQASRGLPAGSLTAGEVGEIQAISNKYGTTIDVVGSRAAGQGRNIETALPKGKGPGTRSDIDFRIDDAHPQVGELASELEGVGGGVGSASPQWSNNAASAGRPSEPPYIQFTPDEP